MKDRAFVTNIWHLSLAILTFNYIHYSFCLNKSKFEAQADLFKDIASKLKVASESVPTQSQVVRTPLKYMLVSIDDEALKKIDDKIRKEESEDAKEHGSCGDISYERDYSFECPSGKISNIIIKSGWTLTDDGTCWYEVEGMNYKGNCDSRQSFKWFSVDQKRDIVSLVIENKCCAFWPRKLTAREAVSRVGKMELVHGSVRFSN
ncbi:uncharacterized protein TA19820 [Theileria annulata]|uniref:CPW-WPC domain-containing protein n=1 Tax=Theileria annulata TaxID=5874 RepID=Q4UG10_THEAN|nr:uncharacterized protein TA19820 [Theileria annulata]CAI73979.1 hypothetical protein TA19820 [Theileria annulata]|eukprot:XP_954659.1 hypothetical protein TA19820 [Theileria annulata]